MSRPRSGQSRDRATCRSPSTGSSAIFTRRPWWVPTERSTGTAARTSTRRASSARSSTAAGAATTASLPRPRGWMPKQLYFPDTNVLITRFLTRAGVGEVQDFMPIHDAPGSVFRHRLIRRVLGVRGELTFSIEVEPRFNYGRDPHTVVFHENGVVFRSAEMSLALETATPLSVTHNGVACEITLGPGESATFVLERVHEDYVPRPYSEEETRQAFDAHDRVLAPVVSQVALSGALARGRAPLGADAQAAHLPAHRRHRRGPHDEPSRAARRSAQLGLPLHVDPRRGVLALRPAAPRVHGRGRRVHGVAAGALHRGTDRARSGPCRSCTGSTAARS